MHDAGGMHLLRVRIREKSRFTIFDIDPVTAQGWGEAMRRWGDAQPAGRHRRQPIRPDDDGCARLAGRPARWPRTGRRCGVMEDEAPVVDVVFARRGTSRFRSSTRTRSGMPSARWLPWLDAEAGAGIHPLRTAPTGYGVALLANRAKLTLRVPRRRGCADALMLAGQDA